MSSGTPMKAASSFASRPTAGSRMNVAGPPNRGMSFPDSGWKVSLLMNGRLAFQADRRARDRHEAHADQEIGRRPGLFARRLQQCGCRERQEPGEHAREIIGKRNAA